MTHVLDRPAPAPDFTARYGDHPDHVVDVHLADGPGLLIFLHGGFWRPEYDRVHTRPLAADLAARGVTVATPEYRRTGWPHLFDDVRAAVAAIPALVAARASVGPVAIAGHSAGGHLALWVASDRSAEVRGAVALAPVADLYTADELNLDGDAVRALLGGGPHEVPERYLAANPAVPVGVPLTLIHGDRDRQVPVRLSRDFARRAAAAGDQVTMRELPGIDHFAVIDPESTAWPVVVEAIFAALGLGPGFDGDQNSG